MKATEILHAFEKARKRVHLVGDLEAGVVIALDMEGRLFTVLNGEILNRVNMEAIMGQSTQTQYLNPGGDGLWPAPEGTTVGFQYSTGRWRVSPGLRNVRYQVTETSDAGATIAGEVDLINSQGVGIPTIFSRKVEMFKEPASVHVQGVESITYIGRMPLLRGNALLAPWTLCQFDCGPGCEVVFPCESESDLWDLYPENSNSERIFKDGLCYTATNGSMRYQIAMGAKVPWIEYRDARKRLVVRREAAQLRESESYVDIRDAAPDQLPSMRGVCYSIYSDPAGFMEIEAVGGCPEVILPNTEMSLEVSTEFMRA
jgi:hypothetical protein